MAYLKILLALLCLLLPLFPAEAAGLFRQADGPVILLAEVQSYGDYELTPEAFDTLADMLSEKLRAEKLSVVSRRAVTNEAGRHDTDATAEDEMISRIHMAAIVRGRYFEYGYAAGKLKHYADDTLGRDYFYDEARQKERQKQKKPYALPQDMQEAAAAAAKKYGADYLLFVNCKDVDVRLKGTVFASKTSWETRGKKMKSQMDYFLVNPVSGLVYEGHVEDKKSAQLINFGLGKTGKGMSVTEMLHVVMDKQCTDIARDVAKKGMKAVAAS